MSNIAYPGTRFKRFLFPHFWPEKQLQSLRYQAKQSRRTAEKEIQKLKKRMKLQSEKISEIKFFCGIGYAVAVVFAVCHIGMCFL